MVKTPERKKETTDDSWKDQPLDHLEKSRADECFMVLNKARKFKKGKFKANLGLIIEYFCTKDKRWNKYKNQEVNFQDHKYTALYRYVNLKFNPRPSSAKKEETVALN